MQDLLRNLLLGNAGGGGGGNPSLNFNFVDGSVFPSAITFTRASSATYFDSSGVLQTAGNDVPRIDYNPATLAVRGFLIEEQRVNSIRNNTMQGAVAGTPGTLPTNWTLPGIGTLTQQVVGSGVVNGISYIDLRYSGTTSNTSFREDFDAPTQIIAANGQTWTNSFWIALVGGSTTNISSIAARITENTAAGSFVTGGSGDNLVSSLSSTLTRVSLTRTLSGGVTVERVSPGILFSYSSGVAIDITLRIGLPQLEQGAFATSVIPTSTVAVTRNADVASVTTLSPWYNASEGTLFAEYAPYAVAPATTAQYVAMFSDGTINNSIDVYKRANADVSTRFAVGVGAPANQVFLNAGTFTAATNKIAAAYKENDFAVSLNGGASLTDTAGTVPVVNNLLLGSYVLSTAYLGGYLRRITYYPARLTNAALQQITA